LQQQQTHWQMSLPHQHLPLLLLLQLVMLLPLERVTLQLMQQHRLCHLLLRPLQGAPLAACPMLLLLLAAAAE
jgi:hypothetical protein